MGQTADNLNCHRKTKALLAGKEITYNMKATKPKALFLVFFHTQRSTCFPRKENRLNDSVNNFFKNIKQIKQLSSQMKTLFS